MVFGLAAHEDRLYAATYEHGDGQRGHVYRLVDDKWQDCGIPRRSNRGASPVGW